MAEINDADAYLFNLLKNDPSARGDLLKHAKRIDPKLSIPEVDAANAVEEKISSALKPHLLEIEELKKKLGEKTREDIIASRRDEVRKSPFYFNDEQIAELEKRMCEDQNQYGSYTAAARYYQYQDMPNHPTGGPALHPFQRHAPEEDDWRSMTKDPKSGIFDRRKRKEILGKKWREAAKPGALIEAYKRGK